MTRSRLLLALFLILITTGAMAQNWRGMLRSTEESLRDGDYFRARKTTIKLINSMMDNLNTGDGAMYTFGLTVAYRAVAEAGLKNYDEADWYWHVAQSLYRTKLDLKQYGDAGVWLANRNEELTPMASAMEGDPSSRQDPVCISRRDPKYPIGAAINKVGEPVTVRVTIESDGSVHHPRLVSSVSCPTLLYAATEAVKDWRFQPAMIDGKAAAMEFDLTVNFRAGD